MREQSAPLIQSSTEPGFKEGSNVWWNASILRFDGLLYSGLKV